MTKLTKSYRKYQLENVATEYSETQTKIKIVKPNGETKWLDIDNEEFKAIRNILLGESELTARTVPQSRGYKNFPKA